MVTAVGVDGRFASQSSVCVPLSRYRPAAGVFDVFLAKEKHAHAARYGKVVNELG